MAVSKKTFSGSCFVIMPFGGRFDSYYQEIFRPAIEEIGLEARRADDLFRPSNIVKDIWKYTQEAEVILADLTSRNPNVFYELGLAHAISKPVVLVTEDIKEVPFDLQALRVIEYDKNDSRWGVKLKEKLSKALGETLESPKSAVLPTFLSLDKESINAASTKGYQDALRQEVDSLRQQLREELAGEVDRAIDMHNQNLKRVLGFAAGLTKIDESTEESIDGHDTERKGH